jgi:hypothetical protein
MTETTKQQSTRITLQEVLETLWGQLAEMKDDLLWSSGPLAFGRREESIGHVVRMLRDGSEERVWGVSMPIVGNPDYDSMLVCVTGTGPRARLFANFIANVRGWLPGVLMQFRQMLDELERTRVQLAACGVAALDGSEAQEVPRDAYGWSASYASVLKTRRQFNTLQRTLFEVACAGSAEPEVRLRAVIEMCSEPVMAGGVEVGRSFKWWEAGR